jgi:hypothetical protein
MSLTVSRTRLAVLPLLGCLALLATGTAVAQPREDLLEQTRRLQQVAAQRLEADISGAIKEALSLAKTDRAKALAELQAAMTKLENDTNLKEDRRASLKRSLKLYIQSLEGASVSATRRDSDKIPITIHRADEERKTAEQEAVGRMLSQIGELRKEGRFTEANRLAAELQSRYPNNPAVTAGSRINSTADRVADARGLRLDKDGRWVAALNDVGKSAMPPLSDREFPKNWKELSERRNPSKMTAKEKAIMTALSTPVTLNFKDAPFQEVMDWIKTKFDIPVLVDKSALDEVQITYSTPVSIDVKGVALRTVLKKILGEMNLAYVIKDETLTVTSAARAKDMMVVRTYYLGDLVASLNPWLPPAINELQMLQNVQQLMTMIQAIDPQSWQANNGQGTIAFHAPTMSLIIKQSAEMHFRLGGK